jgi:hypothetical protein
MQDWEQVGMTVVKLIAEDTSRRKVEVISVA